MKRNYRWSGDEVASETICYPGGTDITTTYTTDRLGRLTAATGSNFGVSGGPVQSLNYEYDRLGNRTRVVAGSNQLVTTNTTSHPNWISSQASPVVGSKIGYWFHADGGMDADGDITAKSTASDSLNAPGTSYVFGWAGSTTRNVITTMTRKQGSNTQVWSYSYDIANRRTQKVGPLGLVAQFYWSRLGLMEDVGPTTTPGSQKTLDEYIWLDGSPVAIVRAKLDPTTGLHVADFNASCWRDNAAGKCQAYGIVNDRLGRPVLAIDHATAITGVGEYDPFGHANRVTEHLESAHPYPATASNTAYTSAKPQALQGLALELRPHFNVFDLENVTVKTFTSKDYLYVLNANKVTVGSYTGLRGDGWTNEWFAPGDGTLRLKLTTNDRNCTSICSPGANQRAYAGFSMDAYEYRRFTNGAQPYFPAFRGQGLYFDSESDQFQNWHRQLDPAIGRYLSPEPLLQSPAFVRRMAQRGMSAPTYAYAANNPLKYIDPDGRELYVSWYTQMFYPERVAGLQRALDALNSPDAECRCGLSGAGAYESAPWATQDVAVNIGLVVPGFNGWTYPKFIGRSEIYLSNSLTDAEFTGVIAHEGGHLRFPYLGHIPPFSWWRETERFQIPEAHCGEFKGPPYADPGHCRCESR